MLSLTGKKNNVFLSAAIEGKMIGIILGGGGVETEQAR